MQLLSMSLRKLHGALSLDVDFRPDVTLLVGINGSGKTSVLNCIEVLVRPDMRRLATLEYERISLVFEQEKHQYVLTATKAAKLVTLSLEGPGESLKPITINLIDGIDADDDEATERYARLGPEHHELPLWDFLQALPRPVVISLDRSISAEAENSLFLETARVPAQHRNARLRSPLTYVQQVTSARYASYRRRAIAADDELKAEIVMSALREPDFLSGTRSAKQLTPTELSRLEEKVVSYLTKTIRSGEVAHQVRAFFHTSRLASRRQFTRVQQDFVLDVVGSRYRQIESLAKAFNTFEKKNAAAFHDLGEYLETVNKFFRDSNKELFFDESTGQLMFSFLTNGVRSDARRGIKHLSSGERQILILFTFLAFASTSSNVFIVDEPELSLHPKWQHEFMDGFLRLKPSTSQLLLATHSPEIVGRHKAACVSLRAGSQAS